MKKKYLIYILSIIIVAQVAFLILTYEKSETVDEAFLRQTKDLTLEQRLNAAVNFYRAKNSKNPESVNDLREFLGEEGIKHLLKSYSPDVINEFLKGNQSTAASTLKILNSKSDANSAIKDLERTIYYFQAKLGINNDSVIQFSNLRDPFRPFDLAPLEGALEQRSPLETVDVSELTLTAVIESEGTLKAYVTLPTGQGFMISKGDSIGRNRGQVIDIFSDKIVILETVKDYSGMLSTKTREIYLRAR